MLLFGEMPRTKSRPTMAPIVHGIARGISKGREKKPLGDVASPSGPGRGDLGEPQPSESLPGTYGLFGIGSMDGVLDSLEDFFRFDGVFYWKPTPLP